MSKRIQRALSEHIMTIAFFITSAAVTYIFSRIYFYWNIYHKLAPNEWGDFFAGAFGPIAFFWLVLGYFLQASELKESINSQKESIQQSDRAIALEEEKFEKSQKEANQAVFIASHPSIRLPNNDPDQPFDNIQYIITFSIVNLGATAVDVQIENVNKKYKLEIFESPSTKLTGKVKFLWKNSDTLEFKLSRSNISFPIQFDIILSYIDRDQKMRECEFRYHITKKEKADIFKTQRSNWVNRE